MPVKRLIIKGKVQGVYFRARAKEFADNAGITGWVRNTVEGSVEALASGTAAQLELFIQWCRRGPQRAVVDEITIMDEPETRFDGFRILR